MPSDLPTSPRILFVDDNIRDLGGHYLELASLLAEGASTLGYAPSLATNACFSLGTLNSLDTVKSTDQSEQSDSRLNGLPTTGHFDVRRMEIWSLGVDGASQTERDLDGRSLSDRFTARLQQAFLDRLSRPNRTPWKMLDAWSSGLTRALNEFRPADGDRIVINTGGDFQILALARALRQFETSHAIEVHFIFHFAVFDDHVTDRATLFGKQVARAVQACSPHRIHLHATTLPLAHQLAEVGIPATAIPYPTRSSKEWPRSGNQNIRKRIVLAGIPRAEKGRDAIHTLLETLRKNHLAPGPFQCSMQMPGKRWKRMVPQPLHDDYHRSLRAPSSDNPLEIQTGNLSSETYHAWLNSADVGLFLYDPKRYVARCSGVLLEFMIRGVPVIVPDQCWLADFVNQHSASGPIGFVYQAHEAIPALLDRMLEEETEIRQRCVTVSRTIAQQHSGASTLIQMGIRSAAPMRLRNAG